MTRRKNYPRQEKKPKRNYPIRLQINTMFAFDVKDHVHYSLESRELLTEERKECHQETNYLLYTDQDIL